MEKRKEKTKESIQAVLPILFIVLLLSFTVAPVSASILLEFMIGAVFVIIGMLFFSMGARNVNVSYGGTCRRQHA